MKSPRIARKPKEVFYIRNSEGEIFREPGLDVEPYIEWVSDWAEAIENGLGIPETFYRRSTNRDHLLEDYGGLVS